MPGRAAMPDAKLSARRKTKLSHKAIMKDSGFLNDAIEPGAAEPENLVRLARLERWYLEHCWPLAEICIVPLPCGPAAPAHCHAVLVPDFARLREQRQPNSRELLRFEFQKASKLLAPSARPQTFSVRAQPLPRAEGGEADRQRLRLELSEPALSRAGAPTPLPESNPESAAIYRLICELRPAACPRHDANLELDLGFDSLDRVQLICAVEQTFGIAIAPAHAARILTAGDLVDAAAHAAPQASGSLTPTLPSWDEILDAPLDQRGRALAAEILKPRPALSFLAWSAGQALRATAGQPFRFKVRGREWLPRQGPYLLVANHCSHLDPLFLLWALPWFVARRLSFLGHTEYFGSGWQSALSKRLKLVPVDPDEHALQGLKLCAEALRRGFIGMVFPEGERSPNGAQERFHRGIALLATKFRVPIVPAAITGTYEVLPRGKERIRFAPVTVGFGRPFMPEPGESERNLLARAWAEVWRLRGSDAHAREPVPLPFEVETGAAG